MFAEVFWHSLGMTDSEDQRRLARYVKARREELGLTQDQMRPRGGPSTTTLTKIENATGAIPPRATLKKLDMALNWGQGSSQLILRGGEPLWDGMMTDEQAAVLIRDRPVVDQSPLIPPGGLAAVKAGVLRERVEALAHSIRLARTTIAHHGDLGQVASALVSAEALITVILLELEPATNGEHHGDSTTSEGAQGEADESQKNVKRADFNRGNQGPIVEMPAAAFDLEEEGELERQRRIQDEQAEDPT